LEACGPSRAQPNFLLPGCLDHRQIKAQQDERIYSFGPFPNMAVIAADTPGGDQGAAARPPLPRPLETCESTSATPIADSTRDSGHQFVMQTRSKHFSRPSPHTSDSLRRDRSVEADERLGTWTVQRLLRLARNSEIDQRAIAQTRRTVVYGPRRFVA
jgi:hypothetical protein